MLQELFDAIDLDGDQPPFPGAVAGVWRDGALRSSAVIGTTDRYRVVDARLVEIPPEWRTPMTLDTVFDLASLTKLFTAVVALTAVEQGEIELDRGLGNYLPETKEGPLGSVTFRQLLTHTAGLQPTTALWGLPAAERIPTFLDIEPQYEPGTVHTYSCPSYVLTGLILERVCEQPLNELVRDRITIPLGLTSTTFGVAPADHAKVAPTEWQQTPDRGIVQGEVHDELSWSLGGVAGNAGLFSTLADVAAFGELLLSGGTSKGVTILQPSSVELMMTNQLPDDVEAEYGQGFGFRLNDRNLVSRLADVRRTPVAGHTGYTGTSLIVDPDGGLVIVLLSNRVHPHRNYPEGIRQVRQSLADRYL